MENPLQLPNRVSRLYPLFALTLILTSATFLYLWLSTDIQLNSVQSILSDNQTLTKELDDLHKADQLNKTTLDLQKKQIADATTKLADLESQVSQKNSELSTKDQQIKNQQDQLSTNATELQQLRDRPPLFSFQNQSSNDVAQSEKEVKQVMTDAYSYIQDVYGKPYQALKVTITFVDSFSIVGSAGEIVITSDKNGYTLNIHLKSFNKNNFQDVNTLIHETVHAFRGIGVLDSSALEEGSTVAATDAIMAKMTKDGKIPDFGHLYLNVSDVQYQAWNSSLTVFADNQAFYKDPQVAKVYQLIGRAWYNLYQADPTFFKDFNAALYSHLEKGESGDAPLVLDLIRATVKKVGSTTIDDYLANNRAFNPV